MTPAERLTRAHLALHLVQQLISNIRDKIKGSRSVQDHTDKISRWAVTCGERLPRRKLSAPALKVINGTTDNLFHAVDSIKNNNALAYAAFIRAVHTFVCDAYAVCPDHCRTQPWLFLEMTMNTLVKAFEKDYPEAEELGTNFYMECAP